MSSQLHLAQRRFCWHYLKQEVVREVIYLPLEFRKGSAVRREREKNYLFST